jgi:hypothetical protein
MDGDAQTRAKIMEHWRASEQGTAQPSTPSTRWTRSWITRNRGNGSAAVRPSRRSAVAIRGTGTPAAARRELSVDVELVALGVPQRDRVVVNALLEFPRSGR